MNILDDAERMDTIDTTAEVTSEEYVRDVRIAHAWTGSSGNLAISSPVFVRRLFASMAPMKNRVFKAEATDG